jgi:hypothetical protein
LSSRHLVEPAKKGLRLAAPSAPLTIAAKSGVRN